MAYREANTAYDFSIFETKPQKSQPVLNVIKNPKYQKRDRLAVLRIISSVILVVTVICIMLYSRAELTVLTNEVGKYKDSYAELLSENTRLNAEMEGKVSLRGIEESAQELGLAKMQVYQVKYVDMEESDGYVTRVGAQEEPTLADKVSLYIQSFLEYIKVR